MHQNTQSLAHLLVACACIVLMCWESPELLRASEEPAPPRPASTPNSVGDVQERGVAPGAFGTVKKEYQQKQPIPPPAGPPPQLCRTETKMLPQCKCFTGVECQPLTALFPNSCPVGSTHCEFVPMSRGPMPTLPPNVCNYQVPFPVTRCSCHNQAECQLLSPFCPGSCPAGSQSCECTPMQRR